MLSHISRSVKSGAAAMPTKPATRCGRASAISNASQPPIDEPTSSTGPSVSRSIRHSASSRQRPMLPSANAPPEAPWPE